MLKDGGDTSSIWQPFSGGDLLQSTFRPSSPDRNGCVQNLQSKSRRSVCCRYQLTERWLATWKDYRTEAQQRWSNPNSQGDCCRQRDLASDLPTLSTRTECLNVLSSLFNTCWNYFVWITCKFYANLFTCWNIFVWLNVTHLMGPVYTPLSPALCALEMLFVDLLQTCQLNSNFTLKAVARLRSSLFCECFSIVRNCW